MRRNDEKFNWDRTPGFLFKALAQNNTHHPVHDLFSCLVVIVSRSPVASESKVTFL